MDMRVKVMGAFAQLGKNNTVQYQQSFTLFTATLKCIDNSLMFNIDSLCDTKDVLHGVCIASILSRGIPECKYTDILMKMIQISMTLRLDSQIDRRDTPFAHIKTPIAKLMIRNVFVDSMQHYLNSFSHGLPVMYCQIAPTYKFEYHNITPYKYVFSPNSMEIFSKSPCEVLLDAYIFVTRKTATLSTQQESIIRDIIKEEGNPVEIWHVTEVIAAQQLISVVSQWRNIMKLLIHDVIFEKEDPELIAVACDLMA